jgi:hypothetical protein
MCWGRCGSTSEGCPQQKKCKFPVFLVPEKCKFEHIVLGIVLNSFFHFTFTHK